MNIEYIAINGKLTQMTKKEAKAKIEIIGYKFQQDINSKTTIVVEGQLPLKKKKNKIKELQKSEQVIKVITEDDFIELITPKKEIKYLTVDNILRILSFVMVIQSFRYTNTISSTITAIVASLLILPDISKKFLNNIVFKVAIPISLFMVAFVLNIESKKSQMYGTWYVDTMTLTLSKDEIKIDVIDKTGRHLLKGSSKNEKGKLIISTDYKEYYYEYDEDNDSLCYLKNKKDCSYYLKRLN